MTDRVPPADLGRVRTYPIAERRNKISIGDFGVPLDATASLGDWLDSLPKVLGARTVGEIATAVAIAREGGRPAVWAIGAHVLKVGLGPYLIAMMERGDLTAIACNGAGAIHDWEIAAIGATSEEVAEGLAKGRFGMAEETGRALADAAAEAARLGTGLGETLGRRIEEDGLPHRDCSVLGAAWRLEVPVTVHVALGSDIVHQHPAAEGSDIGAASFTDFRRLVTVVSALDGGVWVNCGSAVQLPEVFLKALSVAENLGAGIRSLTTVNLDMMRHYRTSENVLRRPTIGRGRGLELTGHHEIHVPLLAAAIARERARLARSE